MARPPLGLGRHGSIRVTRESGQWVARCRFRQLNGVTVRVERWACSKTRIGRVCGVRICDRDLNGVPVVSDDELRLVPIVAVRGKVCYVRGKGGKVVKPSDLCATVPV